MLEELIGKGPNPTDEEKKKKKELLSGDKLEVEAAETPVSEWGSVFQGSGENHLGRRPETQGSNRPFSGGRKRSMLFIKAK